jgi:SAM-dependent methyltransferase
VKTAETLSNHYFGTEGEKYFEWQRICGEAGANIVANTFRKHIKQDDCVLDFGCGGGFILNRIRCGRRVGVEINPAARLVAADNGIECFADLSELTGQTFEVAISNHALEHVPAPLEILARLYRLIKPDGLLVLILPIDDWRAQRRISHHDINRHFYTWTPQLLFNCLQEAGFDESGVDISVDTHAWFPGYASAYATLPGPLFDFGCRLYSILKRRRQLIAVAKKT